MHGAALPSLLRLVEQGVKVKAASFGRVELDPEAAIGAIVDVDPSALICGNWQTAATWVCDDGGKHERASSEQEPVMTAPRRALIVIDAQQEYFDGLLPIQHPPREQSLARIRSTIEAAESADIPVVLVQHELPEGAPIFASRSATVGNHPEIAAFEDRAAKRVSKQFSSVFAQTGLAEWLREQDVDTVTLVGYMTNNCVIGSAVGAEPLGFAVEVLSDATGAIDIANGAGRASAQQVHETLMALLHSNWAAVADTDAWIAAIQAGQALGKSDLVTSAANGRADG